MTYYDPSSVSQRHQWGFFRDQPLRGTRNHGMDTAAGFWEEGCLKGTMSNWTSDQPISRHRKWSNNSSTAPISDASKPRNDTYGSCSLPWPPSPWWANPVISCHPRSDGECKETPLACHMHIWYHSSLFNYYSWIITPYSLLIQLCQ